jgi:Putative zinc-finger
MDRPNDHPNERAPELLSTQDSHLADELLLLFVDGELALRDTLQVKAHLEACWSCRARRERIEESIAEFVEYSNLLLKPHLPPSQRGRSTFLAKFEQLSATIGRQSLWARLSGGFHSSTLAPRRPAWIAALALLCIGLLLFSEFYRTPAVSASEIVKRSEASEKSLLRKTKSPVIYQKLQIRNGRQLLSRTFYRDPLGDREAEEEGDDPVSSEGITKPRSGVRPTSAQLRVSIEEEFASAHLDWKNPLSAASFHSWHDTLRNASDEVVRPNEDLLLIRTRTGEHSVTESTFTVRAGDYHPIAEKFILGNGDEIEVTETAFDVISLDAVNPSLLSFKDQPTNPVSVSSSGLSAPVSRLIPTAEQLGESELRARLILHMASADLGEQIDISPSADSSISIHGLVASEDRKNELLAELRDIPNVSVQLAAVSEVSASRRRKTSAPAMDAVIVADRPLLQEILEQKFPELEPRKAFVDSALGASQAAMAHAWALRRLIERYTPVEASGLTGTAKEMLELLVRDHATAIRTAVDDQAKLLGTLLPTTSGEVQVAPARQCSGSDWRDSTVQLFRCLEEVQDGTAALLAGSADTTSDAGAMSERTWETLASLKKQIPCVYQQMSGDFLHEGDRVDH